MNHVPWEIKNNWEDHQDLKINIPLEIASPNPQSPQKIIFKARVNERRWLIRRNDFPGNPQLTLLIEDGTPHALTPLDEMTYYNEIMHFDTWPEFWRIDIKSPDYPAFPSSTTINEKDAVDPDIELVFRNTKIVHIVCMACIPMMILIAFLTSRHTEDKSLDELMWVTILMTAIAIFTAGVVPKLFIGKHNSNLYLDALNIALYHCSQSVCFVSPLLLVFALCKEGANWLWVFPASAMAAIALTLTFPTRKNWERWRFDH